MRDSTRIRVSHSHLSADAIDGFGSRSAERRGFSIVGHAITRAVDDLKSSA